MPDYQAQAPYFDTGQTESANGYVQILFKPDSVAVQSRELTTLQSLLQSQLENMGDFLFQNGSPVSGGHITFNNTVLSVLLQANDNVTLSDFIGELVINTVGNNVVASVVAIDSSVSSNTIAGALVIKYLSGAEFNDGDTLQIAAGTQETATLVTANATNRASVASINPGVFYVDGYFVEVAAQTIVLDSQDPMPSFRVGLTIDKNIVTSSTDASLLDPAQGSFNWQAPGADRLQYLLTLDKRTLTSTDDSMFFELLRIENGVITSQVEYPVLGNIIDELAARTYDQSGDFTVNPFLVTATDDVSDANSFILNIAPGKGYVKGYEFQTIAPVKISDAKALSTNASTDYYLSLEYGNYITVCNVFTGNVSGFNTSNFGSLDIHIVPSANVNTANQQAYSNTQIGTARIRDIEFDGVGTYLAYLLDVNIKPIVVNAASVSANTTSFQLPPTFNSYPGAILNVPVTVLAGNSSGDVRTILSVNSSTLVATFDRATTQLLDTTSQLSLGFAVKDIEALVGNPGTYTTANVYGTANVSNAMFPCMDISLNGGKDVTGNTIIFSTDLNRLDFSLPQSFIAQNTFSNMSFYNRKSLNSLQFTAGNVTIGVGTGLDATESYTFGFSNSYLPDSIALENFFIVVRNAQTSGYSNGEIIAFDHGSNSSGNGIFQTDSTHVTLDTGTTGNFIADVLLTVLDSSAQTNYRRTKSLIGNTTQNVLLATDTPNNALPVIGTANAATKFFDAANGYVWFTSYPDINKAPGGVDHLAVPDVTQIIAILDSGTPGVLPNVNNSIDITSRYTLGTGQKDNYYDHSYLILRDGQQPPAGLIVVLFQYYAHDATAGFFSADSYSANNYALGQIPVYISDKFGAVALRDCIDFRPTRTLGTVANTQTFTINGLKLPQPDDPMVMTYSFYLPRIDKLILTKNQQFKILSGTPALVPQAPVDTSDSMTLYTITIPAYTQYAANVALTYNENKRYTMRDIGSLDSRITQLETLTALSALESSAVQTSVLYQDGATAKEQYGLISDSFVDFSIADTTNPDLICSISNGKLQPFQQFTPLSFMFASATGPFAVNDRTCSLSYTETPMVIQNTATNSIQIQPFAFGQFRGDVSLRPQADYWYSDNLPPVIIAPPTSAALPPVSTVPPVIASSNVGVTTVLNKANLTPATVTAKAPVNPVSNTAYVYCTPLNNILGGYGSITFSYFIDLGTYQAAETYINNQSYMGSTCFNVKKTATGFGIMGVNGNWVPVSPDNIVSLKSSQTKSSVLNLTGTIQLNDNTDEF